MFSQVGNIFQEEFLMAQCDMIEKDEVMVDLAHVSHVRNDLDGIFCGKQRDSRYSLIPASLVQSA